MKSLFGWEFKTLSFVVADWFDRADSYIRENQSLDEERRADIQKRKLSGIYQFI